MHAKHSAKNHPVYACFVNLINKIRSMQAKLSQLPQF